MSSILLTLSSEQAILDSPSNTSSDFTVIFQKPITLGSYNWELALLSSELWYSVRNVTGNKTIVWSSDNGVTPITVAIPDGVYTIEDINALLLESQETEGVTDIDGTGTTVYGVYLEMNYNTNRCKIVIDNTISGGAYDFTLDLTAADNLSEYLGIAEANYTATTIGATSPDVAGAGQWQIRCDLVRNSYDGAIASDVIFGFTPQSPPNSNIRVDPLHLTYLQVNKSTIYSIRVRYTDNQGNLLDFGGEDTVTQLALRPIGSTS